MTVKKNALMAIGAAAVLLPQTQAGAFSANFDDNAVPAGTYLNGNSGDNNSGVIENGILKITKNVNGKTGGFVIDDLDAGAPVYGFTFTAKVRVGGGSATPADGFSLNFAPDIDLGATGGEDGIGSGITVGFDIFDNGNENPPAPSIDLRVGGQVVATSKQTIASMTTDTNGTATFADVSLTVSAAGGVTLVYKGQTLFDNVYFPGYQPLSGSHFAIVGRTGGLNDNFWFDDVSLTTITTPQVGIVTNPTSETVVAGSSITFAPVINNTDGATFQWLRNGTPINGETNPTLTLTPTLADTGAKFSLKVTGPNNTVTTAEGTLTVVDIPLSAPAASFNFDDGLTPAGTLLFSSDPITPLAGYVSPTGGVNDSGVLHMTDAVNGQHGGIIIEDLAAGAPVYGITAHFKVLVGGGSTTPADGWSFNFASDIPDDPGSIEYENGIGTGLTVGFDIFDNGGGEAPSIDVRYGGTLVAQQKVPLSFLNTGAQFDDVIIRLENDGTIDVAYNGVVVFNNLLVPGFSSITGGRIALGARTGGLNDNMWIDDLDLSVNTTPGDLRITTQPVNHYVLAGQNVTLNGAVNDETGVTYQWYKNGTAIDGATSATYSFTAAAGDNGAQYTLKATRGGLTAGSDAATVTVLSINPTVSYNFDASTDIPAGTILVGTDTNTPASGYISANGGVNDSGALHLTDAVNSQAGAFVVQPLLSGAEVAAINVSFDLRLGGGTANAADGTSFNWASDLPDTTLSGAEEGSGSGLTISFDIYDNGGGEAPSVDIKWKGVTLQQTKMSKAEIQTDDANGPAFRTVIVKITADGKIDLIFGDRILAQGLQIPNYAPIANGKFGWYSRTGGENENQWLDNIQIEAIKSIAPLRVVTDPTDVVLNLGQPVTFSVALSDPNGATYQWFKNGVAIQGATSATYTTPALTAADAGATFTVTATGPGGTATSHPATVIPPITIASPDVTFSFDGADPAGAIILDGASFPPLSGGGYVADGGNGTLALHLTDDVGNEGGSFYIQDFDNGETVSAFTATFKLLLRSAGTPADGVSFVWANDIAPTTIFGEDGVGGGLIVSIDTYDNGGGEAPAIDLLYKGNSIAHVKLPITALLTGDNYADVGIRLESDGTVDLQYNGQQILNNVQLPNFAPMAGGFFALGGRTGGSSEDAWIDDLKIVTTSGAVGTTMNVALNADGSLNITWTGGGTLQSAPSVNGPWSDVTGATSPATVQTSGAMQFFRVAQ
jgi:hypothetical protein